MPSIVITGAAGFIGSCAVAHWNKKGYTDLLLSDDFSRADKLRNLETKRFSKQIDREHFIANLEQLAANHQIAGIVHLGARTDTISTDKALFNRLNLDYSKSLWSICTEHDIPFIYASSAATYGDGSLGYDDNPKKIEQFKPLNEYAESKHAFDKWVLKQASKGNAPSHWVGFKFFNVYGPDEYHKGRMASVVYHFYHQIVNTNKAKLFASNNPAFKDGEQKRDFIYVKDIVKTLFSAWANPVKPGIYNLGTGKARTFVDLANAVFSALNKEPNIDFIEMPADLSGRYQYFTEATMQRFKEAGLGNDFYSLEQGIHDYVSHYLVHDTTY